MFKRIINAISTSFRQESLLERSARMLPGALHGFIAATAYALTLSTINVISFPGLHLAIDWTRLLIYWGGFGFSLALAGVIVGWFTEDYMGIVGGGVVMTLLLLIGNLIVSLINRSGTGLAVQSVVTALPLIGAGILLAGGLRLAINRHLHIQQDETPKIRGKLMAGLVAIVFLIGWIPGGLSRYDRSTVDVIRALNDGLTGVAADPSLASRFPVAEIPSLSTHFGMNYQLYPRPSSLSAGSFDITIRFQDGYSFTCMVSTEGASTIYFTECSEGNIFISP